MPCAPCLRREPGKNYLPILTHNLVQFPPLLSRHRLFCISQASFVLSSSPSFSVFPNNPNLLIQAPSLKNLSALSQFCPCWLPPMASTAASSNQYEVGPNFWKFALENAMLSKIVECWAVVGHCVALLCPHFQPLCHVLQKRCPLIRDVNHHRGSLIQVKEIRPRKEKKQQSALLPLWPPSLVASRRWRAVKKLKSLSLARRPIDEMVGQLILCTAVLLLIDFWTSSLLGFQFILLSF